MSALCQKRTKCVQQNNAYSITSSAIASTPDGIVRPSVLAVLRLITRRSMSALTRKQTSFTAAPMSALCQKRDSHAPQQIAALFNHLIGSGKHGRRNLKAEGLGSLGVDHQLELGRLLNWKIGRLAPLRILST
jgi:hypothetical protein